MTLAHCLASETGDMATLLHPETSTSAAGATDVSVASSIKDIEHRMSRKERFWETIRCVFPDSGAGKIR